MATIERIDTGVGVTIEIESYTYEEAVSMRIEELYARLPETWKQDMEQMMDKLGKQGFTPEELEKVRSGYLNDLLMQAGEQDTKQ